MREVRTSRRPPSLVRKCMYNLPVHPTLHPRYLAVHVRPYPDTCLDLWASTSPGQALNRTAEDVHCMSKGLAHKLAHAVPGMLRTHNLTEVVLVSHPKIRDYAQVSRDDHHAKFEQLCFRYS